MECNITGSRRKVAVIMTGTIALAVAGALITLGVDEFVSLMIQKGVESLLDTAFDEIFNSPFMAASFNCIMLSDMV